MPQPLRPTLSIVMPVFNTGLLLLESVRSVVGQSLFRDEPAFAWELLIIDDGSTDPATQEALRTAAALSPCIRVLGNARQHGVAGARNTGVFAAQGDWVGFLDSDDLWYPDFLAARRRFVEDSPDAVWFAAHFHVGDDNALPRRTPLAARSPCLHRIIGGDHAAGCVSVLHRPVDVLIRCGCVQVMTVQIRRTLVQGVGGFDESMRSAEDYDLWLRLANRCDLHLLPIDAGVYRTRSGSLTRSGRPMYDCEDRMLLQARADPGFAPFLGDIDWRLAKVYSTYCYHHRQHRRFGQAGRYALRHIGLQPFGRTGWRHLLAAALRR